MDGKPRMVIQDSPCCESTPPMVVVEWRFPLGATPPMVLVDWRCFRRRFFFWLNGDRFFSFRPVSLKGGSASSSRRLWCISMEALSFPVGVLVQEKVWFRLRSTVGVRGTLCKRQGLGCHFLFHLDLFGSRLGALLSPSSVQKKYKNSYSYYSLGCK